MSKTPSLRKAAKGLAGALAIASSTSAYGSIVFVNPPPNLTNVAGGSDTFAFWDVNGDGTNDFFFQNRFPNTAPGGTGVIWQMDMGPLTDAPAANGVLSYAGQFVQYA
jgi:hypothetical protein